LIKLFFLFIIVISSFSSEIVNLEDKDEYIIIPNIQIYNNSENLDISVVSKDSSNWSKNNTKYLNFGYGNKTNWLKFEVINKSKKDFFLEFNLTTIDLINIYEFQEDYLISEYKTGLDKPFSSRPFFSNKFIIPLSLKENKKYTIYIEIKNCLKPNTYSFKLSSHKQIHNEMISANVFIGIITGILLIMFFYNFLLYIFTKHKSYRFYLLYIFSVITLSLTVLGYGYMYLYPNHIILNKILISISEALVPLSMILFVKDILDIKEKSIINKVLNLYLFFIITIVLIQIYNITISYSYIYLSSKLGTIFTGIVILHLTLIIIKEIINKNKLAKFLFIAWFFPLTSITLYIINRFYFFIDYDTMNKIVQLSFVLELILMSLIIAYKIKLIEKEKNQLLMNNQLKDLELLKQSKFASMGELLQCITHQWKQPLMRINSIVLNIESKSLDNSSDNVQLNKYLDLIEAETEYMSKTIKTFSQYFHPFKEKSSINLFLLLEETITFYKNTLSSREINFQIHCDNKNIRTIGFKEEYKEVILIIFNNAYEVFKKMNIANKNIICTIGKVDNKPFLSIENNGEKIDINNIHRVFEPYYSTKSKNGNEGMGLYIAKMIIEDSMNKKINIKNTELGVKFTIIG
jgi:two-component system, sensor histidine kinase LadS